MPNPTETQITNPADQVIATTAVASPNMESIPGESASQRYERLYGPQSQASTTQTVQPNQDSSAIASTLQSLQQEIASLKTTLADRQSTPAQTQAAVSKLEWVKKIQEGDFEGAQNSMKQAIALDLQPQLDEVRQRAYNEAMSATQVNMEVDRYLQQVRSANPDILPFERYLQGPVTERVQLAQAAGRIKNPADLIREYKTAVDGEVANLRNLGLQFRAAGKDEALTRTSDVLRSTALNPQQVQSTQVTQDASQSNQGESTDDYFARRRTDEARRRGLA